LEALDDDYFDEELSQAGVYSQMGISKYAVLTPSASAMNHNNNRLN